MSNTLDYLNFQPWINGLCLNPEKTEAVVVGRSERQRVEDHIDTIDTGTVHIKTSDSVKSLGVVIDSMLSFNQHLQVGTLPHQSSTSHTEAATG